MIFKVPKLKPDTMSSDIKKLEDAVRTVKGVTKVAADRKGGSIDIAYGKEVQVSALKSAAKTAGFELQDSK